MKNFLVTGATGFVGQYVVNELLYNNYHVVATSSNEQKARELTWFNKVEYIPFRLEQFDPSVDYFSFFSKPDAMIHLAWEGLPHYKSLFHFEQNLPRHYAFLKNILLNGLSDITITGTCFEYGMREGSLNEDLPSSPANSYALAKDTLRKFLEELQKLHLFQMKWARLFYMYGKDQNPSSLLSQLEDALKNGEQVFNMSKGEQMRDYLPVEKVAEYVVKIAAQNKIEGIINCCSGRPVSVKEFVQDYLTQKGKTIELNLGYYPYADYEPMRFWGDDRKLKTIIKDP